MFMNHNDQDSNRLTITEDAEIRTGPNAAYPIIYKIEKGDSFKKVDKQGKWIEVQNRAGTQKGWVAGWHTNLNIHADNSKASNPLKGKTIVLDPGHGGSDQGASSNTPSKSLEKNYTLKTAKELKKLLEKEGAKVNLVPFVTLNEEAIVKSVDTMVDNIEKANIIFFAGGFSAADEPDGSAKFIVNILLNEKARAAIDSFIARGGLIIGICNGFQALVKSGLLPYGNFEDASSTSPTLFYNDANQHVAKMVETRIANTNSPWLAGVKVGDIHTIPVSHGEGKFVVTAEEFAELRDNGQIFTQYVDFEGKPSMDSKYNPNGSVNAIEGITSKNGQIIGKMGHSERFEDGLFQNIPGNKDQHLFASAVCYFTGK